MRTAAGPNTLRNRQTLCAMDLEDKTWRTPRNPAMTILLALMDSCAKARVPDCPGLGGTRFTDALEALCSRRFWRCDRIFALTSL